MQGGRGRGGTVRGIGWGKAAWSNLVCMDNNSLSNFLILLNKFELAFFLLVCMLKVAASDSSLVTRLQRC